MQLGGKPFRQIGKVIQLIQDSLSIFDLRPYLLDRPQRNVLLENNLGLRNLGILLGVDVHKRDNRKLIEVAVGFDNLPPHLDHHFFARPPQTNYNRGGHTEILCHVLLSWACPSPYLIFSPR